MLNPCKEVEQMSLKKCSSQKREWWTLGSCLDICGCQPFDDWLIDQCGSLLLCFGMWFGSLPCPWYKTVPLSLALSPRIYKEVMNFKPDIIHASSPGIMVGPQQCLMFCFIDCCSMYPACKWKAGLGVRRPKSRYHGTFLGNVIEYLLHWLMVLSEISWQIGV